MKILVWQTAFLGDLILTTPLIASLKRLYPSSKITLVAKPFAKEVFAHNPHLDELIIFDKQKQSFWNLLKLLRKKRFSLAICPHRSHRASMALFGAAIPVRIGFDRAGFSFLFTQKAVHCFDGTHEIKRNLSLLKTIKGNFLKKEGELIDTPQLYLLPEEENFISKFSLRAKEYLVIAPGSKWPSKRWTREGFFQVITYFLQQKVPVVLIGSKEDLDFAKSIGKFNSALFFNLVGKTTLRQSFALIKGAKLLLSNDSAPVHMAEALGTPSVAVFGPTVRDFGFYPYKLGKVVEVTLACRPCGLHGHKACPQKHHHCMQQIEVSQVIASLENFWEKNL